MSQRATCYSCESVALCWQTVAHSSLSQCLWKFGKEKHTDDWCGNKLTSGCDPVWTLTPVVCSPPPICPSDCRGACPTGRHQSQQMVPVQSCCSQCPRDPRLHCSQQTLPLLQRSVCVCTYACVCGLALWLSSCLTPTALHLLWLRPWNRWSLWERVLKPDLTSHLTKLNEGQAFFITESKKLCFLL